MEHEWFSTGLYDDTPPVLQATVHCFTDKPFLLNRMIIPDVDSRRQTGGKKSIDAIARRHKVIKKRQKLTSFHGIFAPPRPASLMLGPLMDGSGPSFNGPLGNLPAVGLRIYLKVKFQVELLWIIFFAANISQRERERKQKFWIDTFKVGIVLSIDNFFAKNILDSFNHVSIHFLITILYVQLRVKIIGNTFRERRAKRIEKWIFTLNAVSIFEKVTREFHFRFVLLKL